MLRTYLRDQNTVADGNAHGGTLAVLVKSAGANSEDLGLVQLLNAGLGQEDAACRLGFGLDTLHEHAVQERHQRLDRAERSRL